MGGKPKLKPDSVGHMGEKKRFLMVSDGFLGYSLVEDLHWKWKMVPWKTMFLYKERGAPLSMTVSGRVSIQASLTVRNALAMRSPRGQKAGLYGCRGWLDGSRSGCGGSFLSFGSCHHRLELWLLKD